MTAHFDARETRDPAAREPDRLARLPGLIDAALAAPGWRTYLGDIDPHAIDSRAALTRLPLLRKSDLIGLQQAAPPFAGFVPGSPGAGMAAFSRLFTSPGPIYEPEGRHDDAWRSGRALFAAGLAGSPATDCDRAAHPRLLLQGGGRAPQHTHAL
jgi:phenylacetate-CoA ligase